MNDFSSQAKQVLQTKFGYPEFRGRQLEIIQHALAGGNSLVLMPTGGGKSLCFQIPALLLHERASERAKPLTLVLSPLVALMKDQVDALIELNIDAAMINSLLDQATRLDRYARLAAGDFALLYVTPERFRKPEFLEAIRERQIELLVVDEAHCISQWGHDFRPDYSRLVEIRGLLGNPPTMALTATATPEVQQDILHQLGLQGFGNGRDECSLFFDGFDRHNLQLEVTEVWSVDDKLDAIESVCQQFAQQSGIVYFTLIRSLEEMSQRLRKRGIRHVRYHGDLTRGERTSIQERFMDGVQPLVLATNAFGMGIDKPDIRFVVHAEVPNSIESYYQEIGRAGRDGLDSLCRLLYQQEDLLTQMEFLRWSNPDADFYHRVYDLLQYDSQRVRAFGIDWLREKLTAKDKHDRRLETALAMLYRFGAINDERDLSNLEILGPLPDSLCDETMRQDKLQRDQTRLYRLVEYVRSVDRREYLRNYFLGAAATS